MATTAEKKVRAISQYQLELYHKTIKEKIAQLAVPNAGNISYNSSTDYPDGSVGHAIKDVVDGEAERDATFQSNEVTRTTKVTDWLSQATEGGATYIVSQKAMELESEFAMQIETTYPDNNIPADNTYYKLGGDDGITSLTIGKITDDDDNPIITKGVIIEFNVPTDCDSFSLKWSDTLYWANSKSASDSLADGYPDIKAGYKYQILISYLNATLTLFGQFDANNS